MGTFQDSDLKQLNQLVALLKRAYFKEMTAPEAMTVTNVVHWVSNLKAKIELELSEAKKPAPLERVVAKEVPQSVDEPKKKVKK